MVTQAGTLVDLGVIASTSGVGIALGLYADSAGAPGALVAQSSSGTLNGGALLLSTPSTPIAAGNYWIAASFGGVATVIEDPITTVTSYCTTLTFGQPLPATFPTVTSYQGRIANFYALAK
jgi:hypothetical protein